MNINSVKLIYFSPTRTTKKILEAIAQSLDVAVVEHHDLTLPDAKPPLRAETDDELTIIGAPVYGGRIPAEAVQQLRLLKSNRTMAVIVVMYGNRDFEDALLELTNLAGEAGFKAIAGGAFIGEHSFSTPGTPIASGRPDTKDIEKAREFGRNIKEKLRILHSIDDIPALVVPGNFPYQEQKRAAKGIPDTKAALCSKCRTCVDVCPTAAVTFVDMAITDPTDCIFCCACVKNCTSGARVFEDPRIMKIVDWLCNNCSERKEPQTYIYP